MGIHHGMAEEAKVNLYAIFGIYAKAKAYSFLENHVMAEQAKVKAYAAFSAGNFSDAVRYFSTAMSVGPTNYLLYSNRSASYARLNKFSEALSDAEKTVKLKPDWSKGYCRLGAAHLGLGRFDDAVIAYKRGLECDPDDEALKSGLADAEYAASRSRAEPERKALARKEKELGNSAFAMKDFDAAIAHYTKAMEFNDEDISYLLNRALAYWKTEQYEECIKDCDKVIESGPELRLDSKMIAIALTRKGAVLMKRAKCSKDYEPAIETFQKALIEHHNPDTLKKLDEAEKAKRHLEQQEHFDPKLSNEGHEKGLEDTPMNVSLKSVLANAQSMASQSQATPLPLNNPFKDVLSWPKMWAKLTANPTTQAYLQNNDFVRMMHELHKIYLTDKRVIQALGVLLNINFRMPTSEDTEMPESSSLMLLPPERKRGMEAELAKEPDPMLLTAEEEEMERKAQAWKEQELGNAAYAKNDFATAITHFTKVMELDDGDISCLMNRAVAYLAMGQYEECIKDCDNAVERGRKLKSDSKMISIALTRKGNALVKMAKCSKDYEPAIETFLKALIEQHNPDTLKKLNDAEIAKRELEHQEYFDTELADEEHEKEERTEKQIAAEPHGVVFDVEAVKMTTDSCEQKKFEIEEIGNEASQTRQTEGIQVEEMQSQALSTLKPLGVVFDIEAVKVAISSGPMEFQVEGIEMEPEASEQHGSEAASQRRKPEHVLIDTTIQLKEARLFLMQGGLGLTEPPKDEDWENTKEIYLMENELSVLPENPRCPILSALFLQRNYKLRTIPLSFFDYMPVLQILNLSRTGIKSLPASLIRLVSLKRLFLNDCHRFMMLSPKVGELKQLEVLDLEGTEIMDLPNEIKKLTNLTCLEVSIYGYTSNGRRAMQSNTVMPCGVISALSQLEELNIDVNPDDKRWDACVEAIVNEVCTLKRLETLRFYFPRVELLRHFQWNSPSLSHFSFTVGRHVKRIMSRVPRDVEFELERWERCLKYINGVGVPVDIKKVLQHATAFFLERHATVKKLSDFGVGNMEQLKCCVVGECNDIQVIIDTADAHGEDRSSKMVSKSYDTERIVLGSLEYLYIYYMKSLRSIWEGPLQQKSLFLLKSLTLRTCPQLTSIFTQGMLDNLSNLEELTVEDCPSIISIVSCNISAELKTSDFLPNLKKISLHYMPGLVSISSGLHIAPKLEWLSFYNCPILKNPLVEEVSSTDLKKIKGERSWWEALEWSNGRPGYLDEIFVPIDVWDAEHFNVP